MSDNIVFGMRDFMLWNQDLNYERAKPHLTEAAL